MEIVLQPAPNDPNLIEKLSDKGVSISAAPTEEKMPSLFVHIGFQCCY